MHKTKATFSHFATIAKQKEKPFCKLFMNALTSTRYGNIFLK